MIKITPGPWHPGCHTDESSKCQCTDILSNYCMGSIATVSVWNGVLGVDRGDNDSPLPEQAIANAHLIAAAPELYDALVAAVDVLEAHDLGVLTFAARVALAKARGEAE